MSLRSLTLTTPILLTNNAARHCLTVLHLWSEEWHVPSLPCHCTRDFLFLQFEIMGGAWVSQRVVIPHLPPANSSGHSFTPMFTKTPPKDTSATLSIQKEVSNQFQMGESEVDFELVETDRKDERLPHVSNLPSSSMRFVAWFYTQGFWAWCKTSPAVPLAVSCLIISRSALEMDDKMTRDVQLLGRGPCKEAALFMILL